MVDQKKKAVPSKSGKRRGRPPGSTKLTKALENNISSGVASAKEGEQATSTLAPSPSLPPPKTDAPKNPQTMQPERLKGPEMRDGDKYFSRIDLMMFELYQEKVKSAALDVQLEEREHARLMLEYEAKRLRLQEKIRRVKEVAALKALELRTLRREIERVYDLDLRKVVYDDESGKITIDDLVDVPEG